MAMYDIGVLCTKTSGRDKGLFCIIVDLPKPGFALIDGQARRRVVNLSHLAPSDKNAGVKKGASHADVVAALKKLKIEVRETKPKKAAPKPVKQRRVKKAEAKREAKKQEKATKKAEAAKKAAAKKAEKNAEKSAAKPTDKPAEKAAKPAEKPKSAPNAAKE